MVHLVQFEEPAASLVRLVEQTRPENVVDAAIEQLRAGTTTGDLIAAAGLAVSCSSELPPGHHGGPVHPVSGLYATGSLAKRLQGEQALLPAVQSVALANKHIHTTYMGPSAMPVLDISTLEKQSKETLLRGLSEALSNRQASFAEHHLLALLGVATPGEIMEVLLEVALPRNALDDHYFLYPIFAFRGLDEIGWDYAPVLLRPPVRYLARHPQLDYAEKDHQFYDEGTQIYNDPLYFDRHAERYGIDLRSLALSADRDESVAISDLAESIGAIDKMADVLELMLQALASGVSLNGLAEALSIGGARLFLRSHTGNPFDVHIHTGINARRYLMGLDDVCVRTKAIGLLSWPSGVEVRYLDETLQWSLPQEIGKVSGDDTEASLLAAIEHSINNQPELDIREITVGISELVLPDSARTTLALARRYVEKGYDPQALFRLTAALVCRDDQSEMHAYKLQHATYEEYHRSLESHRWVHLVSAVKHVTCVVPIHPQDVHRQATRQLESHPAN